MSACEGCGQEHQFLAITDQEMDRILETRGLGISGLLESIRYIESNGIYRHLIPKDSPYIQYIENPRDDSLECFFNKAQEGLIDSLMRPVFEGLDVKVESPTLLDPQYWFHDEQFLVGSGAGTSYRMIGGKSGDISKLTVSRSCGTANRVSTGRTFLRRLWGLSKLPNEIITLRYRCLTGNASCLFHCDIDIKVLNEDGTVATTLGTDVANSPNCSTAEGIVTGTFTIPANVNVRPTQYLLIEVFTQVTATKAGNNVNFVYEGLAGLDTTGFTSMSPIGVDIPEIFRRGVIRDLYFQGKGELDYGFTTSTEAAG